MALQNDQVAKLAKRAAAQAPHLVAAVTPALKVVDVNTDTPTVLAPGQAGNAYPSPPF